MRRASVEALLSTRKEAVLARRRKLTEEQADAMRASHADGASVAELAAEYGISDWTVRRYLNEAEEEEGLGGGL